MVRRLFTLLLAVACACAPALAVVTPVNHEAAECCCAGQCPCAPTESTAPGTSGTCVTAAAPAAVEERAKARKPALRRAQALPHRLLFSSTAPADAPRAWPASAATVALYRAHCSWLI
ncbi:MAG: hypothetical protein Q8N18_13890 [Opitutaceae bacterium]|nr:hypothetical protein [Opitutaceae bacterium]